MGTLRQGLSYSEDFTAKVDTKFCIQYGIPKTIMIIPTYSNDPKLSNNVSNQSSKCKRS